MDDVELELRGIWVLTEEEQEIWTEQNGNLLWGKPRPIFKGSKAKEEVEKTE
jgi:hypothetical protein